MPRLGPASNRVTGSPPSAYGSRLTAPNGFANVGSADSYNVYRSPGDALSDRGHCGQQTMYEPTMNDPRRVNDHLLSLEFPRPAKKHLPLLGR